jgi:hypothetical protein
MVEIMFDCGQQLFIPLCDSLNFYSNCIQFLEIGTTIELGLKI